MATPVLWQVLTNRQRFGLYILGSTLSNIGTWCQALASILLVYRLTESTFLVGLITVAQFSWPIVLAPAAGAVADRFDRRTVLIATQIVGAIVSATLGILTLAGLANVGFALAAVAILGIALAFQTPSQLALVPSIVDRGQLEFGLNLSSAQFNVARAIGPVVASGVIALWSVGAAFLVNALSFFAYIVALRLLRPDTAAPVAVRARFADVLGTVRQSRVIVSLMVLTFVANGAADVVSTLGPAMSVEITGTDGFTGWFVTAFGIGAVFGAIVVSSLMRRVRRRLPWTLGIQAVGTTLFAVAVEPWMAFLGAALIGLGFIVSSNRALTIIQTTIPIEQIGRVTALWLIAFVGGRVLFALVGGYYSDLVGPRLVIAAAAVVVSAAVVASLFIRERRVRQGE